MADDYPEHIEKWCVNCDLATASSNHPDCQSCLFDATKENQFPKWRKKDEKANTSYYLHYK